MSLKGKQKDILLLYDSEDAEAWKDYICDFLNESELKLAVTAKNLRMDAEEITSLCSQYTVVTIVASPTMLTTMIEKAEMLVPILGNHMCVSVILLYTELAQIDSDIKPKYTECEQWKVYSMRDSDEENKKMMSQILDLLENTWRDNAQKKMATGKVLTPTLEPSILKEVCPDCIKQKGEKVVLVFRKPIAHEKLVQVTISSDSKKLDSDNDQKIDTKKISPQCFVFKAPSHTQGKFMLHIYFDGVKKVKRSIRYLSIRTAAYTCPEFLCQLLGLPEGDMEQLDSQLAQIYMSSMPNDGALAHILTPKNIITTLKSQISKFPDELPTLLHFACHYGLQELCTTVMDTPGVAHVFEITNCRDMTPLDLAVAAKHVDLVEYIEAFLMKGKPPKVIIADPIPVICHFMSLSEQVRVVGTIMEKKIQYFAFNHLLLPGTCVMLFLSWLIQNQICALEMHDYMVSVEDIYEKMSNGKQLQYCNNLEGTKGYMAMGGGDRVEDYTEARITAEEDDYEIKVPNKFVEEVEEVLSDEDITAPDIPKKPAVAVKSRVSAATPPPRPATSSVVSPTSHSPAVPTRPRRTRTPPPIPEAEEDIFFNVIPPIPGTTGCSAIDELSQIQNSYKQNEFDLDDIEMLFRAWQDRNRDGQSPSMKERKEHLQQVKDNYQKVLQSAEKDRKKKGFFSRLTSKKREKPQLAIQHNVVPNKYEKWNPAMDSPDGAQDYQYGYTRNRDSTISTTSTASTASSSSCSSHDSARGTISEVDSEDEDDRRRPAPPSRSRESMKENRKSMGTLFLESVQNRPQSRLPTPPPLQRNTSHYPVQRGRSHGSPVAPPRPRPPPRKTSNP